MLYAWFIMLMRLFRTGDLHVQILTVSDSLSDLRLELRESYALATLVFRSTFWVIKQYSSNYSYVYISCVKTKKIFWEALYIRAEIACT